MIDVVVIGLGEIGCRIADRVRASAQSRLVGAVDIDPNKVGRDLGEVGGWGKPLGITVVNGLSGLVRSHPEAVAILATSSTLRSIEPQIATALDAGYHVLSTCEELINPWVDAQFSQAIDRRAREARRSVLGAGINPGFLMEILPLVMTFVCNSVDHVLVRRSLDTNKRRLKLQEKVGVGVDVATFERHVVNGDIGHIGLRTSASLLAEGLGWKLDEYRETIEPVVSKEATAVGGRTFPAKTVIGQHQVAIARTRGREIIRYELDMYVDADETDEIVITGIPDVHQTIRGGVNGDIGTEALITNLIPLVASAPHGLLTMRDLSRLSCTQNPAR